MRRAHPPWQKPRKALQHSAGVSDSQAPESHQDKLSQSDQRYNYDFKMQTQHHFLTQHRCSKFFLQTTSLVTLLFLWVL